MERDITLCSIALLRHTKALWELDERVRGRNGESAKRKHQTNIQVDRRRGRLSDRRTDRKKKNLRGGGYIDSETHR